MRSPARNPSPHPPLLLLPGGVLYDVIERQRLEAGILERIAALLEQCPAELRDYLCFPIARKGRPGSSRPLQVTLVSSKAGWFVSAGGFFAQRDTRWLSKLEMNDLRACLRFLETGTDIGRGLSLTAALRRAEKLKQYCDAMRA